MYKMKGIDELFKLYPLCEAYGECPYRDMEVENKCVMLCGMDYNGEDALDYADVDVDNLLEEGLV